MPAIEVMQPSFPSPEEITYQPLDEQERPQFIVRPREDLELFDCIALTGTCGNPAIVEDWRPKTKEMIRRNLWGMGFESLDDPLPEKLFYTPLVEEWMPADAVTEATMFARARITAGLITDDTPGHASVMEDGFRFIRAVHGGQEAYFNIADGYGHAQNIKVARLLGNMMITRLAKQYPIGIHVAATPQQFAAQIAQKRADEMREKDLPFTKVEQYQLSEPLLRPRVVMSGSGSTDWKTDWQQRLLFDPRVRAAFHQNAMVHTHAPYYYSNPVAAARYEMRTKNESLINMCVIEGDKQSVGATAELASLVALTALHPQRRLGIYMESYTDPANDVRTTKDVNRQRTLFMAHLGRLFMDFRWLGRQIFVATDRQQLADWCMDELAKATDEH